MPNIFKKVIYFSFFIPLFTGCTGEITGPVNSPYFIFGAYFGECLGEQCVEIYMLQAGKLYEDTLDMYPGVAGLPVPAQFELRPDSLYQKVKNLPLAFPSALLDEPETIIGMPDAGDWGGYYVQVKDNEQVRYWMIDRMKSNLPAYLHHFADQLEHSCNVLR